MRATGVEELQEEILLKKAERRVGTTLRDKWRLDSLIGLGGMGAVYRATHRNGMRGAVKLLHPERAVDDNIRLRFLREGYIANKVDHQGAVRILDDDEAEGTVFLVMELLEGMTLEEQALREGGALGIDATMLAADQLLETLAAAHDKGIVHRDIKPANLFVTTSGVIKILDYGIAGLNEPASEARTATQTGVGMGTPAFMAPEQARGRWTEVDAQSDLWSLGATMFWLLSGTTVHDEGTVQEQLAATFMVPARQLHTVAPTIPPSLAAVIDRALRLEKKDRWKDGRAMRRALRTAYEQINMKPMPSPAPSTGSSPVPAAVPKPRVTSSAPPAPIKTTLAATESAVPIPAPPRRRALALLGLAGTLAVIAFFIGFARETEERPTMRAESSTGTATTTTPSPSEKAVGTAVPSADPRPLDAADGGPLAVPPALSAPNGTTVSPARPLAHDAGKRPNVRPREDSIF
jgi:eukaryotic-like serine/threonine-protein kinase